MSWCLDVNTSLGLYFYISKYITMYSSSISVQYAP